MIKCIIKIFIIFLLSFSLVKAGEISPLGQPKDGVECTIPIKVRAQNTLEYNLVVTYIDARLRLTAGSYGGYMAKNLKPGNYEINADFHEPCENILQGLLNAHIY